MRHLEPNIVVIDDVKSEIQGILDYYNKIGLGCKWFNASYTDDDSDTMPDSVYSDVNLIFLDLYYSDYFDSEQCANWVRSIIPEKSFYILVIWTKDNSKADEVKDNLNKHHRLPFVTLIKNKSDFATDGTLKYDFSKLFKEIDIELEKLPALEEIHIWKNNIKLTSNTILGNLAKTSNPDLFTNKLKKIIVSHGGKSIKSNNDVNRKRGILFEALDNILVANTLNNIEIAISQENKITLYNLNEIKEPVIDKELNSWFHFKLNDKLGEELLVPGLISKFKDNDWKKMYSIHDDKIVSEYISRQNSTDTIINSIAMVLSRPCDVAQQKFGKNIKLLSGLQIIKPVRKINNEFQGGSSKPDSIKVYDHLFFNNEDDDITLLFDYRYSFSVPEKIFQTEFDNIKIFNKELLSELQVEYSSYSSRLGITQVI